MVSALLLALCALSSAPRVASQEAQATPESGLHAPPVARDFAGDAACAECHEKEAAEFRTSPHRLDSAIASAHTILGDFEPGKNVVRTNNPDLIFAMIASDDGLFQSAVNLKDPQNPTGIAHRFDLVVGSGRRGQTFLYWDGDRLFELPISYWTSTHGWINSPGYPENQVHFNRPIIPRCLECHATWFRALGDPNVFERDSMMLGIGCERCHGPGREHVERERSAHPPAAGSAEEAIVNPARLARERQTDLCALCHAGVGDPIEPALSYRAGDVLADYIKITPPPPDVPVDVHGNQVSALARSKCFTSGKLTCMTCHNVHEKQESVDAYSAHCLTCHEVKACGRFREMGEMIRTKCVECHMPEGRSTGLTTENGGHMLQAELRRHRIAIYPDVGLVKPGARGTAR